jgi:hypothetical protein
MPSRKEIAMFDDPPLSTALPQRTTHASSWAKRAAKSPQVDELFYDRTKRPLALDSTDVERCHPLTLVALIVAAILSASLTAYIGMNGISANEPPAAPSASDVSHARFGPL